MHQYRHILSRMRLGEADRHLAKARLIGRRKAAELRLVFAREGWLDPAQPLPDDAAIATALEGPAPKVSPNSSVLAYEEQILAWREQGVQGVAIHQALVRKHRFAGHYSSVRRFLARLEKKSPKPTASDIGTLVRSGVVEQQRDVGVQAPEATCLRLDSPPPPDPKSSSETG
jgi:hypothetical protein